MNSKLTDTDIKKGMFITQFELSGRTMAAIERMDVRILGQLADMCREDVFKYRNVGHKTVEELDNLLIQNGLYWKESEKPIPVIKPISESDIIRSYEKIQSENKRMKSEVDKLRDDKFKYDLEKIKLQNRIKQLEEQVGNLMRSLINKK